MDFFKCFIYILLMKDYASNSTRFKYYTVQWVHDQLLDKNQSRSMTLADGGLCVTV